MGGVCRSGGHIASRFGPWFQSAAVVLSLSGVGLETAPDSNLGGKNRIISDGFSGVMISKMAGILQLIPIAMLG